ncbi:MAG TPA: hypothetical protein VFD58_19625 [Blastocatellia bacterium]|nr:hypothetical protein [Blastocatellia bacterium]
MSEDTTRNLTPNEKLDVILSEIRALNASVASLDSHVVVLESKAYDTRPIWEQALAEIQEVKDQVRHFDHKLDILNESLFDVKADQRDLEKRVLLIERRPQNPPA